MLEAGRSTRGRSPARGGFGFAAGHSGQAPPVEAARQPSAQNLRLPVYSSPATANPRGARTS